MGSPVPVVDVVRVAKNLLLIARVPLEGELDPDGCRGAFGQVLGHDRDHLVVNGLLRLVQVLDEFADAALVLERLFAPAVALVRERDQEPRVEERKLAQAARENVELELGHREDRRVRLEGHLRAGLVGVADDRERRHRCAAPVLLKMDVPLAHDLHLEPLAHGVDRAHPHTVQPSAHLVARVIELPSGVEHGHHDLGRAHTPLGHDAHGDPTSIVFHGDRPVEMDRHVHARAIPAEMFVDRIVDDLPDEMMQARSIVHVADVHARPLAYRLEPLEDRDAGAVVGRRRRRVRGLGGRVRHRQFGSFGPTLQAASAARLLR